MNASCPKCGSTQVLDGVPVVSNIDRLSAAPVAALAYSKPDALVLKGRVAHPFLARVCGSCGFAEFYLDDPKGFLAVARRPDADA